MGTVRNPSQNISGITLPPISQFYVVAPQHKITVYFSPYNEIYSIFVAPGRKTEISS